MLLLILGCATTRVATIVSMTPGAASGEVYVLASVVEGYALGTRHEAVVDAERVLLRCQEEAFEVGYATTCHPFITSKEAARAALSGGEVMSTHSRKPKPTSDDSQREPARSRHEEDE